MVLFVNIDRQYIENSIGKKTTENLTAEDGDGPGVNLNRLNEAIGTAVSELYIYLGGKYKFPFELENNDYGTEAGNALQTIQSSICVYYLNAIKHSSNADHMKQFIDASNLAHKTLRLLRDGETELKGLVIQDIVETGLPLLVTSVGVDPIFSDNNPAYLRSK